MGWFLLYDPAVWNSATYDRYARDLLRDRFYKNLERPRVWRALQLLQGATFFAAGFLAGVFSTGTGLGAIRLGLSWLVWGAFVRTVAVWHITWSVNSVTHVWGYRNFDTNDNSRNSWLVGLVSNGEGWHNNHHAQPRSAGHGLRWWELDVSYLTIRALACVGLAWDVVKPRRTLNELPPAEGETGRAA
jgi:stearoyl-CoA desaturase (delta-9 desaturase)